MYHVPYNIHNIKGHAYLCILHIFYRSNESMIMLTVLLVSLVTSVSGYSKGGPLFGGLVSGGVSSPLIGGGNIIGESGGIVSGGRLLLNNDGLG